MTPNERPLTAPPGPAHAVLWDLDGTLIDSADLHWDAWRAILRPTGIPIDPEYFRHAFGKRNDVILRGLFGPGPDAARLDELGEEKERLYREFLADRGLEPLPGAVSWLHRLKGQGYRQVLATSAPLANVEAAVDALGWRDLLDGWVSADEVGVGKPDPAVFVAAAGRAGATPTLCVVVEDAPAGLEGARRAGMRAIGVRSAHHRELQADLVVDSLEDLAEDAFARLLDADALFHSAG